MSTRTGKELVADYIERVWNRADMAALDELTTPTFRYLMGDQPGRDHAEMRQLVAELHTAFPDWRVEIAELVAEGTTVVARWEGIVTHLGPYLGIPATGKRIAVSGINMYHVLDGRVAVEWEQTHALGWLAQMGALPGP